MPTVAAVVVTYRPDTAAVARLLEALANQVEAVIVVDNGSDKVTLAELAAKATERLRVIALGDNLGLAAAQNRGIAQARQIGADYVVLFDQDSRPAADMVTRLLAVAAAKQAAGIRVAAVGPRYQDQRQRALQPFVRVRGPLIGRCRCRSPADVLEVDQLIASGSLIPMAALDAVGDMVETLFIDYIDTEWVLRARQRGYRAYGVCAATMTHVLGETPLRLFGREVVVRSPLRHYYMFRNAVWVYRQAWVPAMWKLADGLRLLQKFCVYALFARPRRAHLWMMLRGVRDGLTGRMGRFEPTR